MQKLVAVNLLNCSKSRNKVVVNESQFTVSPQGSIVSTYTVAASRTCLYTYGTFSSSWHQAGASNLTGVTGVGGACTVWGGACVEVGGAETGTGSEKEVQKFLISWT